ncbi:hypothetical protein HUE58_00305 [Candidatus Ruthia endofausta]|uniref:Uncharacterized protein n=1 Tax=Candidatus Ruthia endofausta TaxID=2738852 RepID=A0A6N0HMW0_9GAMM|nr:hypothetical protein [Candidatus Ruthia endofausta]QKQ23676.1 hypothetical protein HUE58_00305 [Candidatus Ruthia endofausta]
MLLLSCSDDNQESTFQQLCRIPGILQSAENAKLSFEVNGKVKSVYANLGD